MIFNLKSHENQCRWRVKKSHLKHMATKFDMRIQSHSKINMPKVLKKDSNELNNCNVQSNNVADVW